jgi:beta-glucosidase
MSLAWDRIEPHAGEWDRRAIDHYREILGSMRQLDMHPIVTLHHFTNPAWLVDAGGWLNDDTPERFAGFVELAVRALADLCGTWVTINEPLIFAYAAYSSGIFPPGRNSLADAMHAIRNLVRGHALAYRAIHRIQPNALVGVAHHYRSMRPARPWHPLDGLASWLRSTMLNDVFPRACSHGEIRFPWRKIGVPEAKGTHDFLGLNYFTRVRVRFDLRRREELLGRDDFGASADVSQSRFIANEPLGFWEALKWAKDFGIPIYVLENGVEDEADELRRRYLALHIRQLWNAVNFNWPVRGYLHWTLVDNFEWDRGWTQRFGLWELERKTQARKKRRSADFYAAICRENALSAAMVREFAPEAMTSLFPEQPPGEIQPG